MNRSILIILLFIFPISDAISQKIGYRSKPHAIGIGTTITPLNPTIEYNLSMERALSKYFSYGLNLGYSPMNKTSYGAFEIFEDIPFLTSEPVGDIYYSSTEIGLSLRLYRLLRGASAPYGSYFKLGVSYREFQVTDIDGTAEYELFDNYIVTNIEYKGSGTNSYLGAQIEIGKKRYFENLTFIEYALSGTLYNYKQGYKFTSTSTYANAFARRHVFAKSFLSLKLLYGFGL